MYDASRFVARQNLVNPLVDLERLSVRSSRQVGPPHEVVGKRKPVDAFCLEFLEHTRVDATYLGLNDAGGVEGDEMADDR